MLRVSLYDFLFDIHLAKDIKSGLLCLLYSCFYVYLQCHVLASLPFGSISQSVICNCDISCSCTLVVVFNSLHAG